MRAQCLHTHTQLAQLRCKPQCSKRDSQEASFTPRTEEHCLCTLCWAIAAYPAHKYADHHVHLSTVTSLFMKQQFGFSTETLTEDMNTSLQMFRRGWRSAYVAEPNEARHSNNFNNLNYRILLHSVQQVLILL
jgi:hypothetical protein